MIDYLVVVDTRFGDLSKIDYLVVDTHFGDLTKIDYLLVDTCFGGPR
jgi:hypothetical protein